MVVSGSAPVKWARRGLHRLYRIESPLHSVVRNRLVDQIIRIRPDSRGETRARAERAAGLLRRFVDMRSDQRAPGYWDYEGVLFELGYLTSPEARDRLGHREARTRYLIQSLPSFPRTILEPGCGNARSLYYLNRYFAPVVYQGFDQSHNLVRWARRLNSLPAGEDEATGGRFRFWEGDITDPNAFDSVDFSLLPSLILVNDVFSCLNPDQTMAGLRNLVALEPDYMLLGQSLGNQELATLDSYERPRGKWAHNLERKLSCINAGYQLITRDFELRYDASGNVTNRLSVSFLFEKVNNRILNSGGRRAVEITPR